MIVMEIEWMDWDGYGEDKEQDRGGRLKWWREAGVMKIGESERKKVTGEGGEMVIERKINGDK